MAWQFRRTKLKRNIDFSVKLRKTLHCQLGKKGHGCHCETTSQHISWRQTKHNTRCQRWFNILVNCKVGSNLNLTCSDWNISRLLFRFTLIDNINAMRRFKIYYLLFIWQKWTKNILFVWVNALPSKGSVSYNWSVNTYNETYAGILSISFSHLYSHTIFISISQQIISQQKPEIVTLRS